MSSVVRLNTCSHQNAGLATRITEPCLPEDPPRHIRAPLKTDSAPQFQRTAASSSHRKAACVFSPGPGLARLAPGSGETPETSKTSPLPRA